MKFIRSRAPKGHYGVGMRLGIEPSLEPPDDDEEAASEPDPDAAYEKWVDDNYFE